MSAVRKIQRGPRCPAAATAAGTRRRSWSLAVVAALALSLLALVAACGKKGPPHPPPLLIPAQTTDLTVRQTGDRLVLDLTYPAVTTSGLPLAGIEALEVLTLRPPAGGARGVDARTFAATATVAKRIEGVELAAATRGPRLVLDLDAAAGSPFGPRAGDEASAVAAAAVGAAAAATTAQQPAAPPAEPAAPAQQPVTPPGEPAAPAATPTAAPTPTSAPTPTALPGPPPLLIAIRTFGPRGNDSPLSNLVAIVPRTPPPPPDSLTVTPGADGVAIAWTASASATAPLGFDVLRRRGGESTFETRLVQVGADRLDHVDSTAVFGEHYEYTVRTIAARDPQVESADGPVRDLEYLDTFPPATPQGLVALAEEGRIRLLWDRVEAPDLAGYRLYRRENDGDESALERAPGQGNDHADDHVRAGATYTYRVTAVDQQGNESAPSEPAVATPR